MPSLKAIKRRIASVKSTQQITRAMKLVSAARLRRAQEALNNARPYGVALARVADSLLTSEGVRLAPSAGAKPASLLIVVGSDRAQCGGYNSFVLKLAEETRREISSRGLEAAIFPVGRKPTDHYRRANIKTAGSMVDNTPRLALIGRAREIAARILSDYRSGAVEEAGIVYTKFRTAMSQKPTFERLLPVAPPADSAGKLDQLPTEYIVEPSRAELVPVVLRSYLEAAVFNALLESEASEEGARMTAMDSATNNATEMISSYTLEMNRARQAQITRELMDIVGGAEALRG
jgi:F-type H+-transporting ATPase subunit gamma